jgi:hypothetical protein
MRTSSVDDWANYGMESVTRIQTLIVIVVSIVKLHLSNGTFRLSWSLSTT